MKTHIIIIALFVCVSYDSLPQNIASDKELFNYFEVFRDDCLVRNKINSFLKAQSSFYKPVLVTGEDLKVTFSYDDYGNMLQQITMRKEKDDWKVYGAVSCTYDSVGNILFKVLQSTDSDTLINSRKESLTYDLNGRLAELRDETWTETGWQTLGLNIYKYFDSGELESVTDKYFGMGEPPFISTVYYIYEDGNLIKKVRDVPKNNHDIYGITWQFGYDISGKMLWNYSSAGKYVYIYDNENRIVSKYDKSLQGDMRIRYCYNDLKKSIEMLIEKSYTGELKIVHKTLYKVNAGNTLSAESYELKNSEWVSIAVPRIFFNNGNDYIGVSSKGKVEVNYEVFPRKR